MDPSELKRVFQMFDRNGDGSITKNELQDSLKNLGIHIPEEELAAMIEKIDVNGDGCVDVEEFGTLYQTIMGERDEDEDMLEAFNVFDQNGDGFITVEELRSVLSSLGLKQGRTVEECRKMISKVDVDGDGKVNFKEFKQMMKGGGFAALRWECSSRPEPNSQALRRGRRIPPVRPLPPPRQSSVSMGSRSLIERWNLSHLLHCVSPPIPTCHPPLISRSRTILEDFDRGGRITGSLPPRLWSSASPRRWTARIVNGFYAGGFRNIHTSQPLSNTGQVVMDPQKDTQNVVPVYDHSTTKVKRKKLKGRRAVVKWLKFFRWKKKKEYERMTAEEKILYKMRKAKRKEERLVEALKKIEPADSSEPTHDPEILTPEEHFYLLKMGHKCKNYVPVGRRGIFQGVILNMHLHWKKHQTLKVIVKTFTPEEVREIAAELARLSGGIVLDIHEENTIIMYRGKNYAQPPTEIMSPKVTLSRKKALDKSKYKDALRAVRRYIPKLHQDLGDLQEQMKREGESKSKTTEEAVSNAVDNRIISDCQMKSSEVLDVLEDGNSEPVEDDSLMESSSWSETEDLSDMFETDSDMEVMEKSERPLYLDEVEKFPSNIDEEPKDFEEHLRQIAAASKRIDLSTKDVKLADLDAVDKIFLRASSLLKKRR
ncbi:unnamed protein product [Musa hybrid cultivar]